MLLMALSRDADERAFADADAAARCRCRYIFAAIDDAAALPMLRHYAMMIIISLPPLMRCR